MLSKFVVLILQIRSNPLVHQAFIHRVHVHLARACNAGKGSVSLDSSICLIRLLAVASKVIPKKRIRDRQVWCRNVVPKTIHDSFIYRRGNELWLTVTYGISKKSTKRSPISKIWSISFMSNARLLSTRTPNQIHPRLAVSCPFVRFISVRTRHSSSRLLFIYRQMRSTNDPGSSLLYSTQIHFGQFKRGVNGSTSKTWLAYEECVGYESSMPWKSYPSLLYLTDYDKVGESDCLAS